MDIMAFTKEEQDGVLRRLTGWIFTSTPIGSQSIVISVSVCLFVCLSACISRKPHVQMSPNFLYLLPVVVAWSFHDGSAIRYVLPVFIYLFILGRVAAVAGCGLLLQMESVVCLFVCLCVCWSHERALQTRLNLLRCRLGDWFMWAPKNHVLDGSRDPPAHRKEQFRDLSRLGVSAAVYAAKWIIQSSITAWQRNCCSRLQCSRLVGATLHCRDEKSAPAMRPFVKILWPLVCESHVLTLQRFIAPCLECYNLATCSSSRNGTPTRQRFPTTPVCLWVYSSK